MMHELELYIALWKETRKREAAPVA